MLWIFARIKYRSFHEGEEGIADRTKIRLRYYGEQNNYNILKFALEIKNCNDQP